MSSKGMNLDISELNLGTPAYQPNDAFFQVIMHNLLLIDNCLAGLEGYDKLSFPLLVDSLIRKCGPTLRPALESRKKELVKECVKPTMSMQEKEVAMHDVNMGIYGETVDKLYKYLNLEQKMGVMHV